MRRPRPGQTATGMALMVGAIFLFARMDAVAKAKSTATSFPAALWARCPGQTLIGGIGATGRLLLIRALPVAEAGLIAPFGYSGRIFAPFRGWSFFAGMADRRSVTGMVVIASAGIYVWWRRTQAAFPPPAPELKAEARGVQP